VRLVGAAEMRAIDRAAIDGLGVPSIALMDRAGRAVASACISLAAPRGRIVVLCGGGNNGGDGYVAAQALRSAGRDVRVLSLVPAGRLTGDAATVRARAEDDGVPVVDVAEPASLDVAGGDVVLGTGLARPAEGAFAAAIARIDEARRAGARVVAVDVPSGLSADTGRPLGPCVRADRTVTFAFQKRGLVLEPGATLAGHVTVVEIGIPAEAAARVSGACELLTRDEARRLLAVRPREAHKGDAGRLLVVAGSPGKTGAAHLALAGALRGGAGLVTLAARPEVLPFALAGRPEAMSVPLHADGPLSPADLGPLRAAAEEADALVVGPGIPRGPETGELLAELLGGLRVPSVLDADALNAIARDPSFLATLPAPPVLTPHPGEMARLVGRTIAEVQEDRIGVAAAAAARWRAVVVLKGARTVVAEPDGAVAVIPTGNPGMASGGTGDVLAGLVGALLAGGIPGFDAARIGAWVHGRAGDLAAARFGERGLVASDVAEQIGAVWVEWER
jgi:hydroxyethylthiazole kinase-like uncharacterized protein yjeF